MASSRQAIGELEPLPIIAANNDTTRRNSVRTAPARPYSCEGCNTTLTRPSDLRRHYDTVHRRTQAYWCVVPGCKRGKRHRKQWPFARKDKRNEHMRKVHNAANHLEAADESATSISNADESQTPQSIGRDSIAVTSEEAHQHVGFAEASRSDSPVPCRFASGFAGPTDLAGPTETGRNGYSGAYGVQIASRLSDSVFPDAASTTAYAQYAADATATNSYLGEMQVPLFIDPSVLQRSDHVVLDQSGSHYGAIDPGYNRFDGITLGPGFAGMQVSSNLDGVTDIGNHAAMDMPPSDPVLDQFFIDLLFNAGSWNSDVYQESDDS